MAYSMSDLKKYLNIELDGIPYKIVEYHHVKPGKGAAFVRTKLKNLIDGRVIEKTFHAGDKADEPNLERRKYQYSYNEGDIYYFMDTNTYEMLPVDVKVFEESKQFLLDGMEVDILFHNGKVIGVELPMTVELTVTETQPVSNRDRSGACRKPATLETGAVVTVPCHIVEGDKIKVDTRTGEYLEKVK
ncbi:elongation factor P [Lebetimonas natsushimae]|uniref:Elongation factor P n=1 Tax=Lebetimonas natsushimae TaxID=1936991 RepID=A0A292YHQ3_9BACT|nr:elongation factor P [Lebetimonas natsushimae]GAX88194.1 elongation factor P [Lebetimonas natsushimae]